jgi:hypothetical protein
VIAEFGRQQMAEGFRVHRARLAGEAQQFAAAAQQAGDGALKCPSFGAVAAVAGTGGAYACAAFLGARAGAFAAVQAAAAVAHGRRPAGAAGAPGTRAAPWGKVGVPARVAIAQRAGALTLHKVLCGDRSGAAAPPVVLA